MAIFTLVMAYFQLCPARAKVLVLSILISEQQAFYLQRMSSIVLETVTKDGVLSSLSAQCLALI